MKKYVFFLVVLVFMVSCKTVKIDSAVRNIVYPGVQSAKPYMYYEVVFNAPNQFSINKVLLGEKTIDQYNLQKAETNGFLDVKKNDFDAGKYKLQFKSFDIYKNGENNMLKIEVLIKGKIKTISTTLIEREAVHRK